MTIEATEQAYQDAQDRKAAATKRLAEIEASLSGIRSEADKLEDERSKALSSEGTPEQVATKVAAVDKKIAAHTAKRSSLEDMRATVCADIEAAQDAEDVARRALEHFQAREVQVHMVGLAEEIDGHLAAVASRLQALKDSGADWYATQGRRPQDITRDYGTEGGLQRDFCQALRHHLKRWLEEDTNRGYAATMAEKIDRQ